MEDSPVLNRPKLRPFTVNGGDKLVHNSQRALSGFRSIHRKHSFGIYCQCNRTGNTVGSNVKAPFLIVKSIAAGIHKTLAINFNNRILPLSGEIPPLIIPCSNP